jgi:serine/threonine-protein kinase
MARAATASTDASRIGSVLPEYEVVQELGRGGMGVVYLGRHRRLDRRVAIKELPPAFAVDPAVRERFSNEAQTLAGLSHPHIVPIFDYVERDGICLIVMEQLPGGSVWDRFTTTGLTPPTACAVVMACCAALNFAHSKGVLHLDVKPDNLMFDAESAVKVTDFGIARVITGDRTLGTVDGQVLGTPAYMSPEQARGDLLTPSSDVYATGVMLYELLSGSLPWLGAETASELLQQRLNEDPVPLSRAAAHVPEPLEAVVMAALSRDADVRYQAAEDLGVAIGGACVASWGPNWLDHSGVAIFGSERLSRASRTTGAFGSASMDAVRTSGSNERITTGGARANDTITSGPQDPSGKITTGGTRISGASDTVTSGSHDTVTSGPHRPATPSGAHETTVSGAQRPGTPSGAHETTVSGAQRPGTPSGAHETTVSGTEGPSVPSGAHETSVSGRPAPGSTAPGTATSQPQAPASDASGPSARSLPGLPGLPGLEPAAPIIPAGQEASPMFQVVKAAAADQRIEGVDLYRLEVADLIGVEDVLDPPRTPWRAVGWAASLVAVAVLVTLFGLGHAPRTSTLRPGQVELAGEDVVSDGRVQVDLSDPVALHIDDARLAAEVDGARLEFEAFGAPVSHAAAPVRDGDALIDPGLSQRLVAGQGTAVLQLKRGDDVLRSHDLAIDATQTWFLTVPGIGGILLLLLGYANLESSLKPLRAGRARRLSYVGAFLAGLPLAAGIVVVVGALGLREPTVPALVVAAALCAVAGIPTVRARVGVARTRRVRQAVRRAERSMGIEPTRTTGRRTGRTSRSTGPRPPEG